MCVTCNVFALPEGDTQAAPGMPGSHPHCSFSLTPSRAGAFFERRAWGENQSLKLGAVATDGHLRKDLSGYDFAAHCCDIGFVATLLALVNGFAPGRWAGRPVC